MLGAADEEAAAGDVLVVLLESIEVVCVALGVGFGLDACFGVLLFGLEATTPPTTAPITRTSIPSPMRRNSNGIPQTLRLFQLSFSGCSSTVDPPAPFSFWFES